MPDPHEQKPVPQTYEPLAARNAKGLGRAALVAVALAAAVTGATFDTKSSDSSAGTPVAEASSGEQFSSGDIVERAKAALSLIGVKESALKDSGGDKRQDCTSLRKKPKDISVGMGCEANGDRFTRIRQYPKEKGWVYGVAAIKGWENVRNKEGDIKRIPRTYHKCAYVREGVLPHREPRSRAVTHCKNYHQSFSVNRKVYFRDYNCPELEPGLEACKSGTFHSPPSKTCDKKTWRNFATDEPSPFNVFGTGNGAFNHRIDGNIKNSIHYRVAVKPRAKGREAIVIRGINSWGLADGECVKEQYRQIDGTCTDKNRTRNAQGERICGKLN